MVCGRCFFYQCPYSYSSYCQKSQKPQIKSNQFQPQFYSFTISYQFTFDHSKNYTYCQISFQFLNKSWRETQKFCLASFQLLLLHQVSNQIYLIRTGYPRKIATIFRCKNLECSVLLTLYREHNTKKICDERSLIIYFQNSIEIFLIFDIYQQIES